MTVEKKYFFFVFHWDTNKTAISFNERGTGVSKKSDNENKIYRNLGSHSLNVFKNMLRHPPLQ